MSDQLAQALELGLDAAKTVLTERKASFAGYPHKWRHEQEAYDTIAEAIVALAAHEAAPQQEPVASIDDVAANVRVCFGEGAAAFNEGVDALAAEYKRCAAPQQAQAPGWQLVPVEPTPEMESECMGLLMCESLVYERPHGGLSVETIAPVKLWAAMLKAAPQQGSNT